MTTINEQSRTWQGDGGPAEWTRAWDRTRELINTRANCFSDNDSDASQEDGISALATAIYIAAREQRIEPAAVARQAVDDLIHRRSGRPISTSSGGGRPTWRTWGTTSTTKPTQSPPAGSACATSTTPTNGTGTIPSLATDTALPPSSTYSAPTWHWPLSPPCSTTEAACSC
ncbi:hypothetical protein NKH18_48885 [Streptomyces sp. M10(2022)]